MLNIKNNVFLYSSIVLILTACQNHHEESGHEGLNSHLESISVDSVSYDIDTRDLLGDVDLVKDSIHDFYIPRRNSQIKSFPCTNCHIVTLEEMEREDSGKKAHWNIKLEHAEEDVMNCLTCHDQRNMDQLTSLNEKTIPVNFSYKQCAQCHSTQYKDWLGGSHGKNLGGWVEPRVMNSCVNCHDPHKPAFEKRWPARLNTIKLKEQKQ